MGGGGPRHRLMDRYNGEEKDFMNRAANETFRRLVGSGGVVFALDTRAFRTCWSVHEQLGVPVAVYVAERDPSELSEMVSPAARPDSVARVLAGDYAGLDPAVGRGSVVLDHADFNSSWTSVSQTMVSRLWNGVYARRALVRLTVCARDRSKTNDEVVDEVMEEYMRGSVGSGYAVSPLPFGEWGNRSDPTYGFGSADALYYSYGKRMVNMLFLVTRVYRG